MRIQVASVLDAAVLLGSGLGAAMVVATRRVRRTPREAAVVAVPVGR